MTQDVLEKLAHALAKENDGAHATPELTRTRVMKRLGEQRRKRRLRLVVLAPLFGLGIGSTALAASNADFRAALQWIPALFTSSEQSLSPSARIIVPASSHAAADRASEPKREDQSQPEEPREESVGRTSSSGSTADSHAKLEASETAWPAIKSQAPKVAPRRTMSEPSAPRATETPPPPSAAENDIGLALYRIAHNAQFQTGDCRAALEGYRAYLREHPGGALFAEASYNAALCEVRLGRNDAARRSLTPFARGSYGSYRQEEARALLEALSASQPLAP